MKKLMEEPPARNKQNAQKKKDQKVKFQPTSQESSLSTGRRSISSLGSDEVAEIELFDSNEDIRERPVNVRPQIDLITIPSPQLKHLKKKPSKPKKHTISQATASVSSLQPIAEIPKRKSTTKMKEQTKSKNRKKDTYSRTSDDRNSSRKKIRRVGTQFIKDSISTLSLQAQVLLRNKQQGGEYRQLELQAEDMRQINKDGVNSRHVEHLEPNVRQIQRQQMQEQRRYEKRLEKQRRNRMLLFNQPQRIVDLEQQRDLAMMGRNKNKQTNRNMHPIDKGSRKPYQTGPFNWKRAARALPRHLNEKEIEDEERMRTNQLIVGNHKFIRQRSRSIWRKMKPNHYFINESHRRELQNLKAYEQAVSVSLEDNVFKGRPKAQLQVRTLEFVNNFSSFHLNQEQNMLSKTTLVTNHPNFNMAERQIEYSKLKQFQRYVDSTPNMKHLKGINCSFSRRSMMRRSRRDMLDSIKATQRRFLEAARSMEKKFPKQMGVMTDHFFVKPNPKIYDNEFIVRPPPSPSKSQEMDIESQMKQRKKQLNVTKVTIDMSKPQEYKPKMERTVFQQPYRQNNQPFQMKRPFMPVGMEKEEGSIKRSENHDNEINRMNNKQKILTQIEKANKMCNIQRPEPYEPAGEIPRIPSATNTGARKEPSSNYMTTCTVRSTESVKRENKQEGDAESKKTDVVVLPKEGKAPIPHPNPNFFSCNRSSKVKRLEILNRYHYNPFEETEGEDQCEMWKKLMCAEINSIRANYSLGAKEEENQASLIDNLFSDVEKADRQLPIIHNGKLRENDFYVENGYAPRLNGEPQPHKAVLQRKKLRKQQKKEQQLAKAIKAETDQKQRTQMQEQLPNGPELKDELSMSRGYRNISFGVSHRETSGWTNLNAKEEEQSEDEDYVDDLQEYDQ